MHQLHPVSLIQLPNQIQNPADRDITIPKLFALRRVLISLCATLFLISKSSSVLEEINVCFKFTEQWRVSDIPPLRTLSLFRQTA
jgi:hypothetical protein